MESMNLEKRLLTKEKPEKLETAISKLVEYPKSFRLVNEFYETCLSLLRENNLYAPFVQYKATLKLDDESNYPVLTSYFLEFERFNIESDNLACILSDSYGLAGDPIVRTRIIIRRRSGEEFRRDVNKNPLAVYGCKTLFGLFGAMFKMTPIRIDVLNQDEEGKVVISGANLFFEEYLQTSCRHD